MAKSKYETDGHEYGVMHYLTGSNIDDVTCSRCGEQLVWSNEQGWWVTKNSALAEKRPG